MVRDNTMIRDAHMAIRLVVDDAGRMMPTQESAATIAMIAQAFWQIDDTTGRDAQLADNGNHRPAARRSGNGDADAQAGRGGLRDDAVRSRICQALSREFTRKISCADAPSAAVLIFGIRSSDFFTPRIDGAGFRRRLPGARAGSAWPRAVAAAAAAPLAFDALRPFGYAAVRPSSICDALSRTRVS